MLNGYPKSFIVKEINKTLKKMKTNTKTKKEDQEEDLTKMFLLYEKGVSEKIKRIAKTPGVEVIFTRGQS